MSISALYCGAQSWTQHSRCLASADEKNHLPSPAVNSLPNAAQKAAGFVCDNCTLLAHGKLGVHQDPQIFLCSAAFQLASPSVQWWVGVPLEGSDSEED